MSIMATVRVGQRLVSGHSYYDTDVIEKVFQENYTKTYSMIDTAAHPSVNKVALSCDPICIANAC